MAPTQALGHYEERIWEAQPGAPGGRRNRRAFTYEAFIPERIAALELRLRGDVAAVVTDATTSIAQLNVEPPRLEPLEALARQLLRAESLASSRIEGLQLSHLQLARAQREGASARDPTASEVVGNVVAMERAIELGSKDTPIAVADIEAIHRSLLRFAFDRHIAGKVRTKQSWIGRSHYSPRNADYVPPPPERVKPLLEDLCGFLARSDLPALAQAAIAHAQFETIHPFGDGNGRVGRCLIHAVLRRRGLTPHFVPPISLVLGARRKQYIGGLVDYREGRLDDWIEVFTLAAQGAAKATERLADEIARLQERWIERAGRPRSDSAARAIVQILPAYPIVDVPTIQEAIGVSDVAAGKALKQLESAGVLEPTGRRGRVPTWECRELFDLIDALERDL